jgi:imidazolonepropionase-like amidohydrolase
MPRYLTSVAFAALLFAAAAAPAHDAAPPAAPAAASSAQEAAIAKLLVPPATAQPYTITSTGGRHGTAQRWTAPDGARLSRQSLNLRGFRTEIDQALKIGPGNSIQSLTIRGFTTAGDAGESFDAATGVFRSPVDSGTVRSVPGKAYVPAGGTVDYTAWLAEALLAAPGRTLELLPAGKARMEPLAEAVVTGPDGARKTVQAWAISGIDLAPTPVWMDGSRFFGTVDVLSLLPAGWEANAPALSKAQDEALAARAPALVAEIARKPAGAVLFRNVTLYDSEALAFRPGVSVVVDKGVIRSVGPAGTITTTTGATVIEGNGRTLLPGLWDSHQHFSNDATGPLLLSMGVTSVRDPGNRPDESIARKGRIDRGELLGPRIVPAMLIDGPGPYKAQVAVVVANQSEAMAAVDRAKAMGFAGVKLYGSLDPALVKPIADRAHALGLRVQGHIPATMRPLDAVRAGYDEITHINMAMMQLMPDSVVNASNTLARFYGPARHAADVDLSSPEAKAYIAELKASGTTVDVTAAIFESGFCFENGQMPPSYQAYADVVPPAVRRNFLVSFFAPTAEVDRPRMCASYHKLADLVTALNAAGVPVLAGTDGIGLELVRDLELYVKAGMSPAQSLATATIIPARIFGLDREIGAVTPGRKAELFLVDGDVATDFGAIRRVVTVMQGDRLMDAAKLRAAAGLSGMPK